jgi:hypothetical protein
LKDGAALLLYGKEVIGATIGEKLEWGKFYIDTHLGFKYSIDLKPEYKKLIPHKILIGNYHQPVHLDESD